jgi:hypothetical protein
MASFPWWTRQEFVLLVALYDREGLRPSSESIFELSEGLQHLGEVSEREATRRVAKDPRYRSIDAVWAQWDWLLALAERLPRGEEAPQRLKEVWREYISNRARTLEEAESIQLLLAEAAPLLTETPTDRQALQEFLRQLRALIEDVMHESGRLIPEDMQDEIADAWRDLQERGYVDRAIEDLADPRIDERLGDAGLVGAQLRFKLEPFRRAYATWRDRRAISALRRAFRWADVILGSLSRLLVQLDAFKEFKEGTEALLDQSLDEGEPSFTLAPA